MLKGALQINSEIAVFTDVLADAFRKENSLSDSRLLQRLRAVIVVARLEKMSDGEETVRELVLPACGLETDESMHSGLHLGSPYFSEQLEHDSCLLWRLNFELQV